MSEGQATYDTRYLFRLTWPIFIELLLQMMIGNVDQMMISRYSQNSVAAIGNANQILNVLIITFSIVSLATTILVSQYIGSKNFSALSEIYTLAVMMNLVFSLVISGILIAFHPQIFSLMRIPAELLKETGTYISIISAGLFLQALFLTFSAIFRSNAMMKEIMFLSLIVNLINIGGNALLIPRFRIAGAAISSDLSRLVGVIVIIFMFRRRFSTPISLKFLRPFPKKMCKRLLSIGLPAGGESISYNSAQICIQSLTNRLGLAVITTKVYVSIFATVSYMFASAVSQAAQVLVGYLMGAKDTENTDRQVRQTFKMALLITLVVSSLLFIFSSQIFSLFTSDPQVIALGRTIMGIEIALELGRAANLVFVRSLQASGDIIFPIVVCVISAWCTGVGIGWLLSSVFDLGLAGIWIGMACDECLRAVIFILRWKKGIWKTKTLLEE